MFTKFINKIKLPVTLLVLIPVLTVGLGAREDVNRPRMLADVLEKTAQYCDKLKEQVFHFLCYEKVTETIQKSLHYPGERKGLKNFLAGIKPDRMTTSPKNGSLRVVKDWRQARHYSHANRKHERKNIYVNEYQIIKTADQLKERRLPRKFNGKKVGKNTHGIRRMQTVIYSYKNALSPIRFFARENQDRYRYRILKKERIMGGKAYVIEIKPKQDAEEEAVEKKDNKADENNDVLVVAWVDVEDFSIKKFKVFPAAFGGIDYLLRPGKGTTGKKYNVQISDTHYFGKVRNGIRYPSKTEISISYHEDAKKTAPTVMNRVSTDGARISTRLSTIYNYKDYVFFNVSVEEPVFH
jgi:hypothetical protein